MMVAGSGSGGGYVYQKVAGSDTLAARWNFRKTGGSFKKAVAGNDT